MMMDRMYFFKIYKNLLNIAAPTPNTGQTNEDNPYNIGTFLDRSLTNNDTDPKLSGLLSNVLLQFLNKKVSYAIAIPTNNKRIAKIVLNCELSTFSPIFCLLEPKN